MQLDGKIVAPTSSQPWGSGFLQWLQFKNLKGITIFGKGVIDGQGSAWWNDYGRMPSTKPTVATLTCALLFTMFKQCCTLKELLYMYGAIMVNRH